jgi:hypothetical protein
LEEEEGGHIDSLIEEKGRENTCPIFFFFFFGGTQV